MCAMLVNRHVGSRESFAAPSWCTFSSASRGRRAHSANGHDKCKAELGNDRNRSLRHLGRTALSEGRALPSDPHSERVQQLVRILRTYFYLAMLSVKRRQQQPQLLMRTFPSTPLQSVIVEVLAVALLWEEECFGSKSGQLIDFAQQAAPSRLRLAVLLGSTCRNGSCALWSQDKRLEFLSVAPPRCQAALGGRLKKHDGRSLAEKTGLRALASCVSTSAK